MNELTSPPTSPAAAGEVSSGSEPSRTHLTALSQPCSLEIPHRLPLHQYRPRAVCYSLLLPSHHPWCPHGRYRQCRRTNCPGEMGRPHGPGDGLPSLLYTVIRLLGDLENIFPAEEMDGRIEKHAQSALTYQEFKQLRDFFP